MSQAPEENEGTNAVFQKNPNAIFIYSIGAYVAQKYHSAACTAKAPAKGQNEFGCNVTGALALGKISGTQPIVANKINPAFPASYWRTVYNVLRYSKGTPFNMAKTVAPFFSRTGYLCSAKARAGHPVLRVRGRQGLRQRVLTPHGHGAEPSGPVARLARRRPPANWRGASVVPLLLVS